MTPARALLEISNLRVRFDTAAGPLNAVRDVSLTVRTGETLGLIGESGCGKSLTALSAMRLLPASAITSGAVTYRGVDLLQLPERQMRDIRGARISMVFQDSSTAFNPVMTIGSQIAEAVRIHRSGRAEASDRAIEMLRLVHVAEPERRARDYPHQLSGGMRQRAMIAMALACEPEVLIADEPTSALDVITQAQIIEELNQMQRRTSVGILLITHDFGVLARGCDRVAVMYAGRKVEEADVDEILERPAHPYTRALLGTTPSVTARRERLGRLAGEVPSPLDVQTGCAFAPRCAHVDERCLGATPPLVKLRAPLGSGKLREVACFNVAESGASPGVA